MNYLFPFDSKITYDQRKEKMQQEPKLIWLTGLSGSGKSTLALRLEHYLFNKGYKVFMLDGDNVRNGLNKDLSFSENDRKENLRRVAEMCHIMLDAGMIIIAAFISPYEQERQSVRQIVKPERYLEVFVNCPLNVCEARDCKGLYAKARKGIIPNFTGISSPYEIPMAPVMQVNTDEEEINESILKIIDCIEPKLKSAPAILEDDSPKSTPSKAGEINIADLMNIARIAAMEAGKAIMNVYGSLDHMIDWKKDSSPLTAADIKSHHIILEHLRATGLPIMSEEGADIPFEERAGWNYYWLVDPLDGTKEFIKRNGEFTVNIALMNGAVPVGGVVYAPCLDTLYYGAKEMGAYKIANGISSVLPTNTQPALQDLLEKDSVIIVASRSHNNADTNEFFNQFKKYELQSMGSSLKFMLLADSSADIYPRMAPTMEWDTAAAHAILNAVNRKVYQADLNNELIYNKPELLNPSFIAF